ncbi:MAG: TusE/DsrC/DsvC family sulfur relay protein [Pseudomonadota bacterium]
MTTVYESIRAKLHGTTEQTLWSEEMAQCIAAEDGLGELTEAHWKVIHTLRQHFVQYGALPPKELACGINSLESHCVDELFNSSHKAWHVAGLPAPGSEVIG